MHGLGLHCVLRNVCPRVLALQIFMLALPRSCCIVAASLFQVKRWQEEQRKLATSQGIVRTMLGRERRLPAAMDGKNGAAKGHALRAAINTPIQVGLSALHLLMLCRVVGRLLPSEWCSCWF